MWDSASTAKMNEEVSKPFMLWNFNANGSRNCKCVIMIDSQMKEIFLNIKVAKR